MAYLNRQRHLVKVRELRASLKEILDGEEPRIVGTDHEARAFVIPIGRHRAQYGDAVRATVKLARTRFAELVGVLEGL